jgi:hypothetical protein
MSDCDTKGKDILYPVANRTASQTVSFSSPEKICSKNSLFLIYLTKNK